MGAAVTHDPMMANSAVVTNDPMMANATVFDHDRSRTVVNAEHALDATDDTADRAANNSADRTGNTIAFRNAVRNAARDALSISRKRGSKHCQQCAGSQELKLHKITLIELNVGDRLPLCFRNQATERPSRRLLTSRLRHRNTKKAAFATSQALRFDVEEASQGRSAEARPISDPCR
jgi:hypothetical protein